MSFVYLYLLVGTIIMLVGVEKGLKGCKEPEWLQLIAAMLVVLVWPIIFFIKEK